MGTWSLWVIGLSSKGAWGPAVGFNNGSDRLGWASGFSIEEFEAESEELLQRGSIRDA